jgi:glycosyltransferase involved in cell wall biosynthesis
MSDASDEVLDLLYKSCFGLLMTSYAEGYGLPVLEALRLGKPTLVRDIPVFRELGDQSGISYFIDDNPVELARDIISWVDAPLPPITGKEQYTWEQAGAILKVALGFVRA